MAKKLINDSSATGASYSGPEPEPDEFGVILPLAAGNVIFLFNFLGFRGRPVEREISQQEAIYNSSMLYGDGSTYVRSDWGTSEILDVLPDESYAIAEKVVFIIIQATRAIELRGKDVFYIVKLQFADGIWRSLKGESIDLPAFITCNSPCTVDWEGIRRQVHSRVSAAMTTMRSSYTTELPAVSRVSVGIHIIPASSGACSTLREHIQTRETVNDNEEKYKMKILWPKSKDENCGINCIMKYGKKAGIHMPRYADDCRKIVKMELKVPLLPHDLGKIASQYGISLSIIDPNLKLIFKNGDGRYSCMLILEEEHYGWITNDIKISPLEETVQPCQVEQDIQPLHGDEQLHVYQHQLVYGPGGCGKTYWLYKLNEELKTKFAENEFAFTASSGVAACEIMTRDFQAKTFHSFFQFGIKKIKQKILENASITGFCEKLQKLKILIVDEISMLSPYVFNMASRMCQHIRKNNMAFGGINVIMVGDFLQLPPVQAAARKKPYYIFDSRTFEEMQSEGMFIRTLKENWRYRDDPLWFDVLKDLRCGSSNFLSLLSSRKFSSLDNALEACEKQQLQPTVLYGKRDDVHAYNTSKLEKLPGRTFEYIDAEKKKIFLKPKAKVMLTTNFYLQQYQIANGSIGEIISCGENGVVVQFPSADVTIEHIQLKEVDELGREYIRRFIPLELAWSITIHKSQGKTIESVIVDLSKEQIFEDSQAYVAVSRVPKLQHLFILGNLEEFKVNLRALQFSQFCERWKINDQWSCKLSSAEDEEILQENISFRKKGPNVLQLWRNTLFFDFETYWNVEKMAEETYFNHIRHATGIHAPTFIEMKHKFNLKPCRPGKETTMDYVERAWNTVPWTDFSKCILWEDPITICSFCDKTKNVSEATFEIIMQKLREQRGKSHEKKFHPLIICAYNGSGFDFHFFMQKLITSEFAGEYESKIVMKGSKIMQLKLFDVESQRFCMETHDILNITLCSLANASKEFLQDAALTKDVFPHRWMSKQNIQGYDIWNPHIKLDLADFPISMHSTIEKENINISSFDLHGILHTYGEKDVEILIRLYHKLDQIVHDVVECPITKFDSCSQLSWYGLLLNLETKFKERNAKVKRTNSFSSNANFRKRSQRGDVTQTKIFRFTKELNDITFSAIIGGKCLPRILEYHSVDQVSPYHSIHDYYVYVDICSMYVSVMMERFFPYGNFAHIKDKDKLLHIVNRCYELSKLNGERRKAALRYFEPTFPNDKRNNDAKLPFCYIKVTYSLHPNEVEPVVAKKEQTSGSSAYKKLVWDLDERTSWHTNVDLYLILRNEGRITQVHEMVVWEESGPLFATWVTKTFDEKQKAAERGESAKKIFYKTIGNACYGSSLKRDFNDKVLFLRTIKELQKFHGKFDWMDTLNFDQWERGEASLLVCHGEQKVVPDMDFCERPRYLGAFVLSWSRYMLDDIYNIVNPWRREGTARSVLSQPLYGDTDSLLIPSSALERLKASGMLGKNNGQLCDDLYDDWDKKGEFAKVVKFVGYAPKSYALQAVLPVDYAEKIKKEGRQLKNNIFVFKDKQFILHPNGNVTRDVVKLKGISKVGFTYVFQGQEYDEFNFEMIHAINMSDEKVVVKMNERLLRNGIRVSFKERKHGVSLYNIKRGTLERTLKSTEYEGRVGLQVSKRHTVPRGWQCTEDEEEFKNAFE